MTNWTDECVATLRRIWETHSAVMAVQVIAAEHGVKFTRNAVIGKLHRLKLFKQPTLPKRAKPPTREPGQATPKAAKIKQPKFDFVPFVPRIVETKPLHIPFDELSNSVCKYECSGQDDVRLYTFCGNTSVEGKSYCAKHNELTHLKPQSPKSTYFRRAA
jgi:hypothetical protein